MGHLRYITLKGVGEATPFTQMARLSAEYAFAEWEVSYSAERAGGQARYPALDWPERFARKAEKARMNTVLRLCSDSVRCLLNAVNQPRSTPLGEDAQRLFALAERFHRVKLCVEPALEDCYAYRQLVQRLNRSEAWTRIIFPANARSLEFCRAMEGAYGVEMLLERPDTPPGTSARPEFRRAGYGSEASLESLAQELSDLSERVADRTFWVEIGSDLCGADDALDLGRCAQALQTAQLFMEAERKAAGAVYGTGHREVSQLEGFWLDWWVGRAQGRVDLVVPPLGAVRAMRMDRLTGGFEGYDPGASETHAMKIFSRERVALMPCADGGWEGVSGAVTCWGTTMVEAGLRTVVRKHFGETVPANPYL